MRRELYDFRQDPQDYDDFGYREIATRHPKAKKEHRCWLCGDPIEIGHRYCLTVYKDDDGFHVSRQHWGEPCLIEKEAEEMERMEREEKEYWEYLNNHP